MQVVALLLAYVSAAAIGVKVLAVIANVFALTAAQNMQLPPPKFAASPSLVERRLIAQTAPVKPKAELRRVVALQAPHTPLALMALRLDNAETAYEPAQPTILSLHRTPTAPSRPSAVTPAAPKVIAKRRATKNSRVATHLPKRAKNKRFSRPAVIVAVRSSVTSNVRRLAIFETPATLMFRGLLQRAS